MIKIIKKLVLFGIFFVGLSVFAGSFSPAPSSPGASLYTLSDIYNKISAGTSAPGHTFAPSTIPNSTGITLTQLWNIIPPHRTLSAHGLDSGILNGGIYSSAYNLATIEPNLIALNIATGTSLFGVAGACVHTLPSPFYDAFVNLDSWTILSGSWSTNNSLVKVSDGHQIITANNITAEEGIIETRITPSANYSGVTFRVQDADNYYFAVFHPDSEQNIILLKRVGGIDVPIFITGVIPGLNYSPHDLKVQYSTEAGQMRVKISMDGTEYVNYLETSPNWISGGVGCRAYYSGVIWDYFSFTYLP